MAWSVFPACPSYGFTKRPDYSDSATERGSGFVTVNRNWYYPLNMFSAVPLENRRDDDMYKVMKFWLAIGGRSGQFLFKDYTDFKSANSASASITGSDQPLLETGTTNVYQLMKTYVDDEFNFIQYRAIQNPRSGTVIIQDNGSPLTESVDYTIDHETGLVTFLAPALPITDPTWGGEFYVPCMFATTPEFVANNWRTVSTGFSLREFRRGIPSLVFPS